MKKLLLIKKLALLFVFFTSTALVAQSTISGKVTDQTGQLIPGVNRILYLHRTLVSIILKKKLQLAQQT